MQGRDVVTMDKRNRFHIRMHFAAIFKNKGPLQQQEWFHSTSASFVNTRKDGIMHLNRIWSVCLWIYAHGNKASSVLDIINEGNKSGALVSSFLPSLPPVSLSLYLPVFLSLYTGRQTGNTERCQLRTQHADGQRNCKFLTQPMCAHLHSHTNKSMKRPRLILRRIWRKIPSTFCWCLQCLASAENTVLDAVSCLLPLCLSQAPTYL